MRKLNKQGQKMYYALQNNEQIPVYERDEQGNIVYKTVGGKRIPVQTSDYVLGYDEPVEFKNGITGKLQQEDVEAFGITNTKGYALMSYPKGAYPFKEGTLIWKKSEVKYIDGRIDEKSADYTVMAVKDEDLNIWSCLLQRMQK